MYKSVSLRVRRRTPDKFHPPDIRRRHNEPQVNCWTIKLRTLIDTATTSIDNTSSIYLLQGALYMIYHIYHILLSVTVLWTDTMKASARLYICLYMIYHVYHILWSVTVLWTDAMKLPFEYSCLPIGSFRWLIRRFAIIL